jgi:hypothetical protein
MLVGYEDERRVVFFAPVAAFADPDTRVLTVDDRVRAVGTELEVQGAGVEILLEVTSLGVSACAEKGEHHSQRVCAQVAAAHEGSRG